GGSATVDGGIGMAQALGVKFTDKYGNNIEPTGSNLAKIDKISMENLDKRVKKVKYIIASGVENILTGKKGEAEMFGTKKDKNGNNIEPTGSKLNKIDKISMKNLDKRVKKVNFIIASDVENILTGKKGAAAVFGPQKGATPDEVELLDKGLIHYAEIIRRD